MDEIVPKIKQSDLERLQKIAERGKKDFYFFCYYILGARPGFDLISKEPHKWICDITQNWTKNKKLVLLPRDTFKTTICVVAYSIWRMINNPEIAILLSSDKGLNSELSLQVIKDVLESHQVFRGCYGDMVGTEAWSERRIIIKTRKGHKRAPSVMVTGADSERVGLHFDLIIFDDPHNRKNISTPEQILKIINYYVTLHPCMDTLTGQMMVVATRWHHQDLHNYLLTHEAGDWDVYIKAAEWTDENGVKQYFYPSRLTPEFLEKRKRELGTYFYSGQYLNSLVDDENAVFKKDYFKTFTYDDQYIYVPVKGLEDAKIARSTLTYFTLCDPAGRGNLSEQKRLDYTGLIVIGVDTRFNWYVFEAIRRQALQPSDMIDLHILMHEKYHPETMGIEAVTYEGQIKLGLEREFEKRHIFQLVKDLNHNGRAKMNRIKGLQPLYKAGKIYHAPGLFDLETELLSYSVNSNVHDDLIDALAYAKDLAFNPYEEEAELVTSITKPYEDTRLMDADMMWAKSGRRGSFAEFLENFDHSEYQQDVREEEELARELAGRLQ